MGDLKLFQIAGTVAELPGSAMALEKSLQTLFEANLIQFLGVTFLASEFPTSNGGRMDTLGVDENFCPVIIEYKRATNENVINQGLFYLDWLMDHRADFKLLVLDRLGKSSAEQIEWSSPRLICIAGDFTKYDEHAIRQMNRNIELIRYRRFGPDLLMLDQLTTVSGKLAAVQPPILGAKSVNPARGVAENLASAPSSLADVFHATSAHLSSLGDDVQVKPLQFYFAFKRIKNFACLEIRPTAGRVIVYLKVEPRAEVLIDGFTRDMRGVGHFGTGDLEVTLRSLSDLERAKPLMVESYEAS
jgi:predicted transport protein